MVVKKIIKKFIPDFLLSFYHYLLAGTGAFLYGFPAHSTLLNWARFAPTVVGATGKKIKVIGITGTKGKSTVVDLTTKILEEAGYKTASISSIRFKIGNSEWQNKLKMAMPGRFKIQRFLRKAARAGCEYAVLEVSSEGIKQHRHRFIDFDTAVFTNLAPEHIESHGGFENYRKEKLKLFKAAKNIHIINLDDENAEYFLEMEAREKWGYGFKNPNFQIPMTNEIPNSNDQKIFAENINLSKDGIKFSVNNTEFNLNLLGEFNVCNALTAACVGLSQGVSLEVCKRALEKVKGIPGRMEIVVREPFTVIVDYAHTPDSLEKAYKTIKNPKSQIPMTNKIPISNDHNPKLICVIGACGGGRDKWKRPVFGKIAAQYCDEIIITNEDPYDENPFSIMKEIESGFSQIQNPKSQILNKSKIQNPKYEKILDRREAIKRALKLAKSGDTVIITGKGSESWMCIENGKKIPWDDRKIVKEEFSKNK